MQILPGMLSVKLHKSTIDRFGVGKGRWDSQRPWVGSLLPSQCRAQCSSVRGLFGVAVLPVGPAPLQPGWQGLLGAG